MSVHTDGQLCYGVQLQDPEDLPRLRDERDEEADKWWRRVNGFKNPHESPFTYRGECRPEYSMQHPQWPTINRSVLNAAGEALWEKHRAAEVEWDKANPMPFEEVNVCSCDYPMYVLAVPGTLVSASRGDPEDVSYVAIPERAKVDALLKFCDDHGIETDGKPARWILSSLWC